MLKSKLSNEDFDEVKFISNKKLRFLPNILSSSSKKLLDKFSKSENFVGLTSTKKKVVAYHLLEFVIDGPRELSCKSLDKAEKPFDLVTDKKLISAFKEMSERAIYNIMEMNGKLKPGMPILVEISILRIDIKSTKKNFSSVQWHLDWGCWPRAQADYSLIYEITENIAPHNWIGGELFYKELKAPLIKNPIAKVNGVPNQAALVDNHAGPHMLTNIEKKHKNTVVRDTLLIMFFLPDANRVYRID